jgi:hypothetical protein
MSMSQHDASEALDAIAGADQRVREYKAYREASGYLIVWGVVWLVANAVTGLAPEQGGRAWLAGVILGTVATVWLVIRQSMRARALFHYTKAERVLIGRRVSLTGVAMMGFFPAMLSVLAPLSPMQSNAFISLFWAFAYMVAGAWLGLRLFVTGAVTAVGVLVGYFLLREHYFVWMAAVGGGSLILGGLWLRKL